MENEYATLNGQLQTSLDFASLSSALKEAGVASRIGESSHYVGGYYLRIMRGQAELTFEKIEESEYLMSGDAPFVEEMNALAKSVSDALRDLTHRHRLEIYLSSQPSRIIGYFHFDWPRENINDGANLFPDTPF